MKCQRCEKPATFHITELTAGKPQEFHLCEQCAREYLSQSEGDTSAMSGVAGMLKSQLVGGAASTSAEELAALDKRSCPVCGITFFEFRNQGRLGCPHDYVCFERELDPLVLNIHSESKHVGKRPARSPASTDAFTDLIRLRRELKDAVKKEDYERAGQIRDEIRQIEARRRSAVAGSKGETNG